MYVCVYMYVCMYVCMCHMAVDTCMYTHVYMELPVVSQSKHKYVSASILFYRSIHVYVYVHIPFLVCVHACTFTGTSIGKWA